MISWSERLNLGVGTGASKGVYAIWYKQQRWNMLVETVKAWPVTARIQIHGEVQILSLVLCVTFPLHVPRDPMLRGFVLRQLLRYL